MSRGDAAERESPATPVELGVVFQTMPDAVVIMDADGVAREWNPAAERMFGISREQALGVPVADLIVPGPLREAHRNGVLRFLQTRESAFVGHRVQLSAQKATGEEFPVELTVEVIDGREPPMFLGFVHDLRVREQIRQESVRLAQRMAFLAQTGLVLDRSLELDEMLRSLAQLTVPELAQLTVIDLYAEDGYVHSAVAAAEDPSQARALERSRRADPVSLASNHPVAESLRSGQPLLLPEMSPAFLAEIAASRHHLELMRQMGYYSAIVVPLVARRRVLGALSLLRMEGTPPYDQEDLVLAEELGRRAALAIDNGRLFQSTRDLARTLQESLLPNALPQIPQAQIAARYRAAAEGQVLGGDFYDAFRVDDERWGIVIGDVCGKGPEAAALTALARYTIRALADYDPDEILRRLNTAVFRDQQPRSGRFLTALYLRARAVGAGLELEVAAGGHPPPLVLREDGSTDQLEVKGPLLGLTAEMDYSCGRSRLHPGDTLVLYTDGLTDARAPEHMLSPVDLLAHLTECHGLGPEEIAAHLEQAATGGGTPRDDIALLVVQVESGPTSAELQPRRIERSSAGG